MRRSSIRRVFVVCSALATVLTIFVAVPASATTDPAGPPRPGAGAHICYQAQVSTIGWREWVCDGNVGGTTGRNRAVLALRFKEWGRNAVCGTANVRNFGWQNWRCGFDGEVIEVGIADGSDPMYGLALQVGGEMCLRPHVKNVGWRDTRCSTADGVVQNAEDDPLVCDKTWPFGCVLHLTHLEAVAVFLR
jgi:Clostridial hydrophobic W